MAESYFKLSRADRVEALGVAATASGRPAHLLEKDIWVVWALQALFESPEGENLVFKGGTSLSKAYGVIQRFSEDIDLTYDVRKIIPELAKGDVPLPASNAQAKKWRDELEPKLDTWVKETALPILEAHLKKTGGEATFVVEGSKIVIQYDRVTDKNQYMPPTVTLEFGARSTGEPAEVKPVSCFAAEHLEVEFPTVSPRAMLPIRTFWEKATAVHAFCLGEPDGDRISRHWYDLVQLDKAGYADQAFADRKLAKEVAEHKARFFRERDRQGNNVDYVAAVSGGLKLVPDEPTQKALAEDYQKMADAGMLPDDAETFEQIIERCRDLEKRANIEGKNV